jgi:hypothetical protein
MTLGGVGELWISDIQLNLSDQAGKKAEWSDKPGFAPANLDFSLGLFERATG